MPIQIQCPSCSQALRVPEAAIGKTVRCPKCQNTFAATASDGGAPAPTVNPSTPPKQQTIPNPFGPANPSAPANPFDFGKPQAPASNDPFAGLGNIGQPPKPKTSSANPFDFNPGSSGPVNPYAAPVGIGPAMATTQSGDLVHQMLRFDWILNTTWEYFKAALGTFFGVGLVLIICYLGIGILVNGIQFAGMMTKIAAIAIISQLLGTVVNFCGQTFLQVGTLYFALQYVRTSRPQFDLIFAGGKWFVQGCLLSLLVTVILMGAAIILLGPAFFVFIQAGPQGIERDPSLFLLAFAAGGIPFLCLAIWVTYRWFFAFPFLIDRNVGVMEALSLSTQYTERNKLTMFLAMLVIGIICGVVAICTCYLGAIPLIPMFSMVIAICYLGATGQFPQSQPRINVSPPITFPK